MSESGYPSGQVMIKIDGARIKAIREARGLTQLYIATVVDVTTDTVSRWENKRYPSIKKENGLKLAHALEVELEEILDTGNDAPGETGPEPEPPKPEQTATPEPGVAAAQPEPEPARKRWYDKIGHFGILLITAGLLGGGILLYSGLKPNPEAVELSVTRIVAPHFIAGQPLPVFLHIDKATGKPVSIILKEVLPPGCRLNAAVPPLSGSSAGEIKWLTKVTEPTFFFYTVITDPSYSGDLSFAGIVKNGLTDDTAAVAGDVKTVSGLHHWGDTDGDNRISDEEILMVYDLLSGDTGQIIDIDQLEEMWLGDGYVWDPDRQTYTIME